MTMPTTRPNAMRVGALLLATPFAALPALPALAHGPTRQKAEESITIAAPPAKVWAVIGHYHDMSWDPAITSTTGSGGDTPQSIRTLTLKSGGQLTDDLEEYDASKFTYSTFMAHNDPKILPVTNFSSHLTVTPADNGHSTVEWTAAFYRGDPNGNPAPGQTDADAKAAVHAFLKAGLDGLKAKFPSA